jgi:hypothetical protein
LEKCRRRWEDNFWNWSSRSGMKAWTGLVASSCECCDPLGYIKCGEFLG